MGCEDVRWIELAGLCISGVEPLCSAAGELVN